MHSLYLFISFLIEENVTLGLTFAVCHKRDFQSIFFANYNPYIWSQKSYCHDHSRRFGIEELRLRQSRNARFKHSSITITQLGNRQIKTTKTLSLRHEYLFFVLFCVVKINTEIDDKYRENVCVVCKRCS